MCEAYCTPRIGMMDQARIGAALAERHPQCRNCQLSLERSSQRPPDDLARECVQYDRQVHKLGAQADVGDVRHPKLVDSTQRHPAREIRIDRQIVSRVRGDHKRAPAQIQQVVLPQQVQHALMIHLEAAPLEFHGHAPITIRRPCERDFLQLMPKFHVYRQRSPRRLPPVITRPAQAGHFAQRVHSFAFRRGLANFFKQTSAPLTMAAG